MSAHLAKFSILPPVLTCNPECDGLLRFLNPHRLSALKYIIIDQRGKSIFAHFQAIHNRAKHYKLVAAISIPGGIASPFQVPK